jgi:hypothetical protein
MLELNKNLGLIVKSGLLLIIIGIFPILLAGFNYSYSSDGQLFIILGLIPIILAFLSVFTEYFTRNDYKTIHGLLLLIFGVIATFFTFGLFTVGMESLQVDLPFMIILAIIGSLLIILTGILTFMKK